MRIAFCDDEKTQSIFLKELTDTWEQAENKTCTITVYGSAEEMLFENQVSFPFDFILLDIEMDKMNGIDLARQIRKYDKNVYIAFLSNRRDYVFEGYEVGAVRYLLKPLKADQFFPLLTMVQNSLDTETKYIIISSDGEKIKLETDSIAYVEALGHYSRIYTADKIYEVKLHINEILERLGEEFIQVHRSYLVNISQIERISRVDCILSGGVTVPISRNSYQSVNRAFIEFFKGGAF